MNCNQSLDDFMSASFPELKLQSPLFYNASVAIRFELGGNIAISAKRAEQVKQRAVTLFNAVNHGDDDIYIVVFVDSWDEHPVSQFEEDVLKIYRDYTSGLTTDQIAKQEQEFRYRDPDEPDDTVTLRYSARLKAKDINIENLLVAIANCEMGFEPTVIGDIFFVNQTNRTIFYLYDDRGLDVVATKPETLKRIYEQYNSWILDYDRPRINNIFS